MTGWFYTDLQDGQDLGDGIYGMDKGDGGDRMGIDAEARRDSGLRRNDGRKVGMTG